VRRWIHVAIIVVAVAGCGHSQKAPAASTDKAGQADELALLTSSKIELADAIKAAQEKAPGRVIDAELHGKNGKTVWEVDLAAGDGTGVEVDVDAESGQVIDSEASAASAHVDRMELIKSSKIELADAIKAALEKANGRVIDTELRAKNGKTVWEVDVAAADGKTTEVDVDAGNGQVLDAE
jgi:uncharacterized membrane protein YkoI